MIDYWINNDWTTFQESSCTWTWKLIVTLFLRAFVLWQHIVNIPFPFPILTELSSLGLVITKQGDSDFEKPSPALKGETCRQEPAFFYLIQLQFCLPFRRVHLCYCARWKSKCYIFTLWNSHDDYFPFNFVLWHPVPSQV